MATAGDIINRALRTAGILAAGEVADYDTANDALVSLNDLLSSLSNEGLMIYQNTLDTLTLDGAASYTFGTDTTPDINSTRPVKIHSAFYRDTSGIDYPVEVVTLGEFDSIPSKTTTSDIVEWVYVNYTYPNATIHVYPVSSGGTLRINSSKPFTAFAGLTTSVSLPNGYERTLRYGLATELMVEYGLLNPAIAQQYIDAKADLKRTNFRPYVLRTSLPFGRMGRNYRIESDG